MIDDFVQVTWNEQLEDDCRHLVRLAVREDFDRFCDWTTVGLVPAESTGRAAIVMRSTGVVAGLRVATLVLHEMQANVSLERKLDDGDSVAAGTRLALLEGAARDMLAAERIS